MASTKDPSPNRKELSQSNGYLKYSGLALQLLAALGFFGWLGHLIDNYLSIQFPAFMLLLGLMAFGGMMFIIYRSINNQNS